MYDCDLFLHHRQNITSKIVSAKKKKSDLVPTGSLINTYG